jgi:predicted PurR-regulated permease PerM
MRIHAGWNCRKGQLGRQPAASASVGKETEMPDYLVLISTLGGIAAFGLSGFVIGPLVAALFIAIWDIFFSSRQSEQGDSS